LFAPDGGAHIGEFFGEGEEQPRIKVPAIERDNWLRQTSFAAD
jgi:hypothetical protein